jgi:hypothetical protein
MSKEAMSSESRAVSFSLITRRFITHHFFTALRPVTYHGFLLYFSIRFKHQF